MADRFLPPPRFGSDRGRTEARVLRERMAALSRLTDRVTRQPKPYAAARQLVQVFDGGAMGAAADLCYFTHPVLATGPETEGGAAVLTVDTNTTIPVVFLQGAPAVGDYATAYAVGGRWVSERGMTAGMCAVGFKVNGCAGLGVDGVTVSIYDPTGMTLLGSGVTAGGGAVVISFTGATTNNIVTVTGFSGRFNAFSETVNTAVQCGLINFGLTLTPASTYACSTRCAFPIAKTLYANGFSCAPIGALGRITGTWTGTGWVFPYPGGPSWGFCGEQGFDTTLNGFTIAGIASIVCPPAFLMTFVGGGTVSE